MKCKSCNKDFERQPWRNQRTQECNPCRAKRMQAARNERRAKASSAPMPIGRVRSIFDWRP